MLHGLRPNIMPPFLSYGCLWADEFSLSPTCLFLVFCLCLCNYCSWHVRISLNLYISTTYLCAVATLVSCLFSNCLCSFSVFHLWIPVVTWRARVRRLICPSSVWGQHWYTLLSHLAMISRDGEINVLQTMDPWLVRSSFHQFPSAWLRSAAGAPLKAPPYPSPIRPFEVEMPRPLK